MVSVLTGLLFMQPGSAQPTSTVSFDDRLGDLGHPAYDTTLDPMEPTAYWPVTSPVGSAYYLDMLGGWMSIDEEGTLTAGLTVAAGLTAESTLPEGVKAVWWTWFLYKGTGYFNPEYAVHFCWDGSDFEGVVFERGLDEPAGEVIAWSTSGNQIVIEFDSALVPDTVAWFAESICWNHCTPHTDLGYMPTAGWFAADIIDGPFLPWLPMPG